jgi:hypothetical protein
MARPANQRTLGLDNRAPRINAQDSSHKAERPAKAPDRAIVRGSCYHAGTLITRALTQALALALVVSGFVACGERERPGYVRPSGSSGGKTGFGGATTGDAGATGVAPTKPVCDEPPPVTAPPTCENDISQVAIAKPNLYFLLDISGSMSEPISSSSSTSKIAASKQAILRVIKERGPRLNYGLAAFPMIQATLPDPECAPGKELFSVTPGDPLRCGELQNNGPVLNDVSDVLLDLRAGGGTPLSPSVKALAPQLLTLKGQTALLVLTDGAPNCNPDAKCTAANCALSAFGEYVGDIRCGSQVNCCDSSVVGDLVLNPGSYCFDADDSVRRISDLKDAGVRTFIVGVPGASELRGLMNSLAEAGGTARSGDTKYFDVRDHDQLDAALDAISAEVAVPCELELDPPPDGSSLLNVYLDRELVPSNSENGWSFRSGKVTLLGDSCAKLQSGEATEVAVVSGCGTVLE